MKRFLLSSLLGATLSVTATLASADCYADYKAKQDNPLRLHYGVVELRGDCARGAAQKEVRQRLQRAGWVLLNVVSVFGPEGLQSRKDSAGQYYLRF
jgi:hypothetical protein